jgi:ribosomal-protein-alanine N-acetyltransferase
MHAATVHLRPPRLSDEADFLAAVRRSRRLHRGWVSPPSTAAAFREYLGRSKRDDFRALFVCRKDTGVIAGVFNISQIFYGSFQSAYLGFYAFAGYEGQGLMREGLELTLRVAFGKLRLHRLEANIQPANGRSIALVKSLGFRMEGFSPHYLKIAGRWRDHERWAILREQVR